MSFTGREMEEMATNRQQYRSWATTSAPSEQTGISKYVV